jgi:hypothetical protein
MVLIKEHVSFWLLMIVFYTVKIIIRYLSSMQEQNEGKATPINAITWTEMSCPYNTPYNWAWWELVLKDNDI